MARARNLKPSLFKNELLGVADPLLTILFESLWCLADRAGRLEDRPLRIKAETFPYREGIDVNVLLTELARLGFICRYKVGETGIIQIINFEKHQNPHKTEKNSELPEMPLDSVACGLAVKDTLNNGSRPADSLLPLTDSLLPLTDSGQSAPAKPSRTSSKSVKTAMPENFTVSEKVWEWAKGKGFSDNRVSENFAKFALYAEREAKKYVNWDAALMNAIGDNWAKTSESGQAAPAHSTENTYKEYRPK